MSDNLQLEVMWMSALCFKFLDEKKKKRKNKAFIGS